MDDVQTGGPVEQPVDPSPPTEQPSVIRRVFKNRFHQWRAGWRMLLYVVALFGVGLAVSALFDLLMNEASVGSMGSWAGSLQMAVFDLVLVLVAIAVLRRFDRRPAGLLGVGFERRWLVELSVGIGAGIVSTGGLTLILVLSGMVSLELSPRVAEALIVMPRYLVLFTVAAAAEELIFRGYLLQVFAEGSRRWLAAVLMSLPFAVVHLGNPDVTVVGISNIFLVGIVIAILYFQTLRLWLPIGYHLSWNWAHGWLWGFDVSGIELDHQVFVATPNGPELLTGGGFGLEGSVLTTILIIAVAVWLLMKKILTPTAEMTAKWAPYPRGFGLPPFDDKTQDEADKVQADEVSESRVDDDEGA